MHFDYLNVIQLLCHHKHPYAKKFEVDNKYVRSDN